MNGISWQTLEYRHREHAKDWYWAVGIITIAATVTALILKDFLFALFILIAAFAMVAIAGRKPRMVSFEINDKGVIADRLFYSYDGIESFWVEKMENHSELLLKLNRDFMPQLIVPLGDLDPEEIREFLLNHLHEVEQHEQILHKFMDYLGF